MLSEKEIEAYNLVIKYAKKNYISLDILSAPFEIMIKDINNKTGVKRNRIVGLMAKFKASLYSSLDIVYDREIIALEHGKNTKLEQVSFEKFLI